MLLIGCSNISVRFGLTKTDSEKKKAEIWLAKYLSIYKSLIKNNLKTLQQFWIIALLTPLIQLLNQPQSFLCHLILLCKIMLKQILCHTRILFALTRKIILVKILEEHGRWQCGIKCIVGCDHKIMTKMVSENIMHNKTNREDKIPNAKQVCSKSYNYQSI